MLHTAHGYWLEEAPAQQALPPLAADLQADVAIVGGGYTGMWAAWQIRQAEPEARVVLIESERCGEGPSGRNGGFVNSMWFSLATMRERFGSEAALTIAREASRSVDGVGEFCKSEGVDAWYRKAGYLQVSTAPAQDGEWGEAISAGAEISDAADAGAGIAVSPEQVAGRCRSPIFRGGAFFADAATVQPARLARGLRSSLEAAGVPIYESTACERVTTGTNEVELRCSGGRRIRANHVILACGGSALGFRGFKRSLTMSSSHIVLTEPVPDLLEQIGWTGGECITDARHMIHYFRTTPDGRIAFGWGGGRVVRGARLGGHADVDPGVVAQIKRDLVRFFPGLEGRQLTHAWGGPIDISPTHLPIIQSRGDRVHAAFGYTGNGVGPSHMLGRILAELATDRRSDLTRLPLIDSEQAQVPPEPFRYFGGSIIRRALLAKEAAQEQGRRPNPIAAAVAGIPERIGIHVGR